MPGCIRRCPAANQATGLACGKPVRVMSFAGPSHCEHCELDFCSSHRLVEDHSCIGLDTCKEEAYRANALQLEKERTQVIKVA